MRILIDMDGVIADFEKGFLDAWRKLYPEKPFIPLENRTVFYVAEQYLQEMQETVDHILYAPSFFKNLQPIAGSTKALLEMKEMGIDIYICTSPLRSYQNCVLEKYEWVENYFGYEWTKKLVLTRDKTIIKGDLLIDDRPHIEGVDVPAWEHIVFEQPYNKTQKQRRHLSWSNWKEVLFPQA